MNNLQFSLMSIENTSDNYLNKFGSLKLLKVNEKLIIHNNILYLDESYSFIQPFKRWLTSQNRITICNYLKNEFDNYFIFLKMLDTSLDSETEIVNKYKIRNIMSKHENLNKEIVDGLNNLSVTYIEYSDGIKNINNIISNLQKYISYHVDKLD